MCEPYNLASAAFPNQLLNMLRFEDADSPASAVKWTVLFMQCTTTLPFFAPAAPSTPQGGHPHTCRSLCLLV